MLSDVIDISEKPAALKTAFLTILNLAITIDPTISLFCAFHYVANSYDCRASVVDAYGPLVASRPWVFVVSRGVKLQRRAILVGTGP